jgi:choline dehydrogenase-like flavoprotein
VADHTQAYLVTTHEGGAGSMRLENGRLQIEWPHVGDQPIFERVNETLAEATRALGGKYLINPVWSAIFNKDLITVHPLGGCVMAADAAHGVVNHKGQAFSGGSGTAVHEGLYVCDGSTIPRSLGAGPLLTISALSERACALLARDRGWHIDYALPSRPPAHPACTGSPAPLGIQFTETARGDGVGTGSDGRLGRSGRSDAQSGPQGARGRPRPGAGALQRAVESRGRRIQPRANGLSMKLARPGGQDFLPAGVEGGQRAAYDSL